MFDLEDIPKFILQPILKGLLAVLRLLWFLSWELWVDWILWSIGWAVLKLVTFGRYPSYAAFEYEKNVPFWTHFFVCAVGSATLASAIYTVSQLV